MMTIFTMTMMMTNVSDESAFLNRTDSLFARLEDELEAAGFDTAAADNVLTAEADNGTQVVVNRHLPKRELWIASRLGGYHFAWDGAAWRAARDGAEFFAVLNRVLSDACGETVAIAPF